MTAFSTVEVYYGSQTGNAEWLAKHIYEQCSKLGFKAYCGSLNQLSKSPSRLDVLYVFVISTTGHGEAPDNAIQFFQNIDKYKSVNYALLGMGDSSYTDFCSPAKEINRQLACKIMETEYADDSIGLELVIDPWVEKLFRELDKLVAFDVNIRISNLANSIQSFTILDLTEEKQKFKIYNPKMPFLQLLDRNALSNIPQLTNVIKSPSPMSKLKVLDVDDKRYLNSVPVNAMIHSVRCLTGSNALKRVIELELEYEDDNLRPGDCIGVVCPNDHDLVLHLLKRLEIENPTQTFELTPLKEGDNILKLTFPISYYHALKFHFDLNTIPRKSFYRMLADYARDPEDKKLLLFLCSKQGLAQYKNIGIANPTLYDILCFFPSVLPPFEMLLENLLPLQPRYFSLTSCGKRKRIAFNVLEYEVMNGDEPLKRKGLCTCWLDNLTGNVVQGSKEVQVAIPVISRVGDFRVEENRPLIFLAGGTGITPFISFLEHIRDQVINSEIHMYYGCRSDVEYLYKEELKQFQNDIKHFKLNVTFSRCGDSKRYVQDELMEQKDTVLRVMNNDGIIYVCGDSKTLVKDVNNTLVKIIAEAEGKTIQEANLVFCEWIEKKRYRRDVW